ncbi:MAG TPA: hypothetical protein VGZ47_23445 [Gemmataceae bacterium]|nr:hypothetical protein [Gemmataceae bacterium]
MRALCGAIITAGALIGLGLTAMGIGFRYQAYAYHDQEGKVQWVSFRHIDSSLMIVLVGLIAAACIGLGISFVGLAYHHHRRHHELLHLHRGTTPPGGEHRLPA